MASTKQKKAPDGRKIIASNRRARYDFHLLDKFEAGIALTGSEVKSLRDGQCSIGEAFAQVKNGEVWLIGMHVAEYFEATHHNHAPLRQRKLLLKKQEIRKIQRAVENKGMTLVPFDIFFNERGWAKVTLHLAQGKKAFDKRQAIKKREQERELRSY